MEASNATKIKARRKKTKSEVYAREVSVGYGDQHLREGATGNNTSLKESEQGLIEFLTEQNRLQASRIQSMEAASNEDQANFKAQLQESKSKVESLESEKRTLLELIDVLSEKKNRQSAFREQVAYLLCHPASIVCLLVIILGVSLHWIEKLNSENLLLRQQIVFANEQRESLQSEILSMRVEFKEKNDKAMAVRLQENQFNLEGVNYLVRCMRDEGSASERFTGINLFWGAVQVGYTTRSGLDNCLTMYQAQYHQRISYS